METKEQSRCHVARPVVLPGRQHEGPAQGADRGGEQPHRDQLGPSTAIIEIGQGVRGPASHRRHNQRDGSIPAHLRRYIGTPAAGLQEKYRGGSGRRIAHAAPSQCTGHAEVRIKQRTIEDGKRQPRQLRGVNHLGESQVLPEILGVIRRQPEVAIPSITSEASFRDEKRRERQEHNPEPASPVRQSVVTRSGGTEGRLNFITKGQRGAV